MLQLLLRNCQINTFTMKEWDRCKCFCAFNTVLFKKKNTAASSKEEIGNFKRAGLFVAFFIVDIYIIIIISTYYNVIIAISQLLKI